MFTGIIEDVGVVETLSRVGDILRVQVRTALDLATTKLGDSIAVDGVCLTVTEIVATSSARVTFDIGPESLRVTALGHLRSGQRVHLERALAVGDRLGGHIVQGHVDGVGTLVGRKEHGETLELRIAARPEVLQLCIPKGSITLDGVSLTVNRFDHEAFEVWLIPHTLHATHLGTKRVGDTLHLENDVVGKYVQRLLSVPNTAGGGITWDLLRRTGFSPAGER